MKEFILEYWLEVLFGAVTGCLAWVCGLLKKNLKKRSMEQETLKKEQKLLREGMLAILHDRLFQAGRYYTEKGEITFEEIKNVEYLYNSYHALGGNGTGTEIWERVKNLPVK